MPDLKLSAKMFAIWKVSPLSATTSEPVIMGEMAFLGYNLVVKIVGL